MINYLIYEYYADYFEFFNIMYLIPEDGQNDRNMQRVLTGVMKKIRCG